MSEESLSRIGPYRGMSAQDSLWLTLDRPENLMMITSVLWTDTPVDPDRLREVVAERLLARYPVYLQRPVPEPGAPHPMAWATDPDFDLSRHLVVRPLPQPADKNALQDFVARRRSEPFDPEHPLWSLDLLQGYGEGSALLMRSHHAMADGIRLTQVMFGLLEPVGHQTPPPRVGGAGPRHTGGARPAAEVSAVTRRAGERVQHTAEKAGSLVGAVAAIPVLATATAVGLAGAAANLAAAALPANPRRAVDALASSGRALWHSAGSVVKLLGPSTASGLWDGEPGVAKTAVWGDAVPLTLLKDIGHTTGTTVNDVCVALVAGALDRYLAERRPPGEEPPAPRDVAWMLPVSLSSFDAELPETLGNHFSLVLAQLPLGRRGFHERLLDVHRRVARIRDSHEARMTFGMQHVISRSPSALAGRLSGYFADKAVGVLTNVPGPREPMSLAGTRVTGVVGWAPCNGRQAITICVFSYADGVQFGFGTDRGLIPDPERLVVALAAAVDEAVAVTSPR